MKAHCAAAVGLVLVPYLPSASWALDAVSIGEGGALDWRGEGAAVVTTIDAEQIGRAHV